MIFSLLVSQDDKSKSIDEMLSPFDEKRKVAPYIKKTKQESLEEIILDKSYDRLYVCSLGTHIHRHLTSAH